MRMRMKIVTKTMKKYERKIEDQNIGDATVELENAVKDAVQEWNSKFLFETQ
jgi:hypothetical protein